MNIITLQFIKKKKKKKKPNYINKNLILKLAKNKELPEPIPNVEKKKNTTINRRTIEFQLNEGKTKDIYQRSPSQVINNFQLFDKKMGKDNQIKNQKIYEDEEFNIIKEGDFIIINDIKYDINSFKENIYIESTYLDELIEDTSKN